MHELTASIQGESPAITQSYRETTNQAVDRFLSHEFAQSGTSDSTDLIRKHTMSGNSDDQSPKQVFGSPSSLCQSHDNPIKENIDDSNVGVNGIIDTPCLGPNSALAKYRPTTAVPTFEELHAQNSVAVKDPLPGDLRFPGAFDDNGRRIPIQKVFRGPEQSVLPSPNEPLWKQMLAYCQLWGVWVATVEDDKRRSELVSMVTKKMQNAWQIAIENGHCGTPNGHEHCCRACESSDKKLTCQRDNKKRLVNVGKHPAPFACDGPKHQYSILNRELEQAGITMDSVIERLKPEDLEAGNKLLKEMCGRLNRDHLEWSDWTVTKYPRFDPRINQRNLFMFCLWEVQRCWQVTASAREMLAKGGTLSQQKAAQRRLDVHQQRADQHLALALVLSNKSFQEGSDDESQSDDQSSQQSERPRRSLRVQRPAQALEILSNDEQDGYIIDLEIEGGDDEMELVDHHSSYESTAVKVDNEFDKKDQELVSETIKPDCQPELDVEQQLGPWETIQATQTYNASEVGNDISLEVKLPEVESDLLHYEALSSEADNHIWTQSQVAGTSRATDYPQTPYTTDYQNGQSETVNASEDFLSSLQKHAQAADPMDMSNTIANGDWQTTEQYKEQFILEHWQPWMNSLLHNAGYDNLKWNMKSWNDIKAMLQQLNYSPDQRNVLLKHFKEGFTKWHRSHAQAPVPPPQMEQQVHLHLRPATPSNSSRINNAKIEFSTSGPTSHKVLNQSRTFSFRYFTSTTQAERDFVDDAANEYMSFIIHSKTQRMGYYAVFVAPGDPQQKELAHGFWDLQKGAKVKDADWFYQNQPRPVNFRDAGSQKMYHDWGYSLPPPKTTKGKPKPKKNSSMKRSLDIEDDDDAHDEYDDNPVTSHSAGASSRGRSTRIRSSSHQTRQTKGFPAVATNSGSRKRRKVVQSETESDGDWQPE